MITLRLPNGDTKQVAEGTRPREVAESIGKRLAQAAVAAKVNGEIVDLNREITPSPLGGEGRPTVSPSPLGGEGRGEGAAVAKTSPSPPAPLPPGERGEITFQILTDRDAEALAVLRHSCAHVMARAVMRLFPGTQLAFGPALENGFYYDIDSLTPIREEDFPKIEAEMAKIIKAAEPFERFERPTPEAKALVADLKQGYKVEHIDDDLKQYPSLSFYRQGEFIDLCRGPHIPHAGKIGAFKLLSIAGAYWKNDQKRKQLQRLYGTCYFNQKDLDAYLTQLEEAKKRDHRVLGKQLKLFTISQVVGSGLILWMPKGATVRGILESFIRDELIRRGYQPVYSPHIGRLEMYRRSGHFPYYRDAQFPPMFFSPVGAAIDLAQYRMSIGAPWYPEIDPTAPSWDAKKEEKFKELLGMVQYAVPGYLEAKTDEARLEALHKSVSQLLQAAGIRLPDYESAKTTEERHQALRAWLEQQEGYLLKPMNCPHHIQIYKAEPRSYRDLPVRLAEFGTVYRFEQTGELSGMTRVRGFTQDDAHLFVTPEQIEAELEANIDLVLLVLSSLGLSDYRVRIGLRDPASDKYVGEAADWDNAEKTLIDVVAKRKMNYAAEKGEAAFYGPKIDFVVRDCIGREWQLGTVQLDYNLPKRFELEYVGADNKTHRPVMIHRAPFGSMERFMGILIEHFAGAFPLWLAPEQVRVMPVSEKFADYGRKVEAELRAAAFRVTGDYRPEKIGYKIREASADKVPYHVIVGEKEQSAQNVAVRDRALGMGKEAELGAMSVGDLIERLNKEVKEKRIREVKTATAGLSDSAAKYAD